MSLLVENDFEQTDGLISSMYNKAKKKLKTIAKHTNELKEKIKKKLKKSGKVSEGGKEQIEKTTTADVPDVQLVY